MKNALKWILLTALLAVILVGAAVLYGRLGKEYGGNNLMQTPDAQSEEADESGTSEAETEEGKGLFPAPDFTIFDEEGNEVKLSDYIGTPVVLNFWASWCYYCKQEMPDFDAAYENHAEVRFLMVNATDGIQETVTSAKEYAAREAYHFDIFFDTKQEAVNAYSVNGLPTTFFIDKDGNLIAQGNGMLDSETLEKGIKMITESESE